MPQKCDKLTLVYTQRKLFQNRLCSFAVAVCVISENYIFYANKLHFINFFKTLQTIITLDYTVCNGNGRHITHHIFNGAVQLAFITVSIKNGTQ